MNGRLHGAALGALAVVLLVLAGFGVTSARRTDVATKRALTSVAVSDLYQHARFAVAQEESLERKYRLEPGVSARANFDQAVRDLDRALGQAAALGTAQDRARSAHLHSLHLAYLREVKRMFLAVDAHDDARVLGIDAQADPRFDALEDGIDAISDQHSAAATRGLHALRGTERSVLTATPIVFAVGLLLLAICTFLLVELNRRLARHARESEHAALHDALTGLANRTLFAQRLTGAVAAASRDQTLFSVLMIDLDRFKEINDTLGHTTGDRLLREIGPRLTSILRDEDTVARLGGDEFALLLPTARAAQAKEVASRALAVLRQPFTIAGLTVTVDASVGIVTYPTHGDDAETLLQRADIAMYLAKGRGRGDALYDPAADPYDPERLLLIGDLRRAVADDELELHYQPKYATGDMTVAGVEALVRWRHPERGLLAPGEFIALAEHTGLIRPLTTLVLRKAARQARAWQDAGHDIPVAVNLSVANLLDSDLVTDVSRILAAERLAPERLELEITESTVMTDPDRAIARLEQLAAMGIRLAIDDYGTGHSSLAYLRRLPVHELKIDRSFVRDLAVGGEDLQIVRSTIELGHNLGLRVVAEGVEDAESLALLQELRCDLAQGFHLARPAPADDVTLQLDGGQAASSATSS
jgi:diguanylate cyclase (GGDEF)-like protein